MSKRTLTVGFLTAGLSVGVVAGLVSPALAQGNPVGGEGNYFFLSGAGSTGGAAQTVIQFGNPNDETFYGDWDNDGVDSPMVRRGNTFFTADARGQLQSVFSYGDAGDQVYIGDWDGNGTDTIAVRRDGNQYLVKNDNKSSGVANAQFGFGDATDTNVLVGDWDAKDGDSLMIQRGNEFFVKNVNSTGKADFTFAYGDPGDPVMIGDWADPEAQVDGNGADQIAVRHGANEFILSTELGADGTGVTEMRRFNYGDAGDQVFVAALPTAVLNADGSVKIDIIRTLTYSADTSATYAGGEPVLKLTDGTVVLDQVTGKPMTHKAGDPKLHIATEKQVYRGGEVKLGVNGKSMVYIANGATPANANEVALPTGGVVDLYADTEVRLNADGSQMRTVDLSANTSAIVSWNTTSLGALTAAQKTYTAKAGDPVLRRAGEQMVHASTEQKTWAAGTDVVLSLATDVILNPDGTPAKTGTGAYQYQLAGTSITQKDANNVTVKHQAGDLQTRRAGELQVGYTYNTTSSAWEATAGIQNDEIADVYTKPGTAGSAANTSTKVSDLDVDLDQEPLWYLGTEPIFYAGTESVLPFVGGEAVVGHKAGDPILKDGKTQTTGTGKAVVITGDGLGVRRFIG